MAKLCMTQREIKRRKTVDKFKARRDSLIEIINDSKATNEQKFEARKKLQALPRNASPVRLRNRCALTGRPRGVYSKFGIARGKLRDLIMHGEVPGVIKASW
ncbi:MAG: 30S ribosomal protein S14 [Methylophilaceae bacterium]|jgi:small subunit ribosomal protein S14|nr:30S ribosomal protein S14 [Methylophilaceae bacterium]MBL6726248.1 30S ribosomal protein S14 [Methylophilaceae bacterium]MBL6728799.1 30S ribosomal protein S14 [Methylophilaceae bacterium]MBL6790754.1 30S ribosomal protein S14 [Methylophilaceae bacterium]